MFAVFAIPVRPRRSRCSSSRLEVLLAAAPTFVKIFFVIKSAVDLRTDTNRGVSPISSRGESARRNLEPETAASQQDELGVPMNIEFSSASRPQKGRSVNEDAFLINRSPPFYRNALSKGGNTDADKK